MAFECQESTEISKNLANYSESNHSSYNSAPENLETSKPSLDFNPKKGISSFYGSKQLPPNDVFTNARRSITDLPPALVSEILNYLDPKELGIISCVSTILHNIASEHHVWKEFYCERWGLPVASGLLGAGASDEKSWKKLFVERDFRSKTFLGRCSIDVLYGHTEANKEFRLWEHEGPITSLALDLTRIYSGSWDMTVRVWDRSSLKCTQVLRHGDWVWSLVPHDTTVVSTSASSDGKLALIDVRKLLRATGPCSYGCLHREAGVERFIETTASIYMPLVFNDSQMVGMCTFLIHLQFQLYANSSGV
ncbi:hypothetical protein GOBAR_DD26404 [Gossypium barbadense]|nr:hypothetical protein GOBAR_DD26404 [Gossypium barbadense]